MFYRNTILPRLNYIPFFFTRVLLELINVFTFHNFRKYSNRNSLLCIESGVRGWELIEYKELYNSAIEFLGNDAVEKVEIITSQDYISQVKNAIKLHKPTHYFYDARTGSQNMFRGLMQSIRIAIIFQINGIIPICLLTDCPMRTWRSQCGIVSAKRGLVLTLMSPKDIHSIFPHNRIIGPMTMPFSNKTSIMLDSLVSNKNVNIKPSVIFTGSLYEPRTSILEAIKHGLEKYDLELEIKGRILGEKKASDEDYWLRLVNATVVITTSNQISSKDTDFAFFPHLIYRYIEVPASGSLLIAQTVPSIERYFKPNEHFVSFDTPEDAVNKISYYMKNTEERDIIAKKGFIKAQSIIKSNLYWVSIELSLGKYSIL